MKFRLALLHQFFALLLCCAYVRPLLAAAQLTVLSVNAPKTIAPGDTLRVLVKWKVAEVPDTQWTTVMELLHLPAGPKYSSPLSYSGATPQSKVGDVIEHRYEVTLPFDAPPGDYELRIEHYRRGKTGWERMANTNDSPDLKRFVYAKYHIAGKEEASSPARVAALPETRVDIKLDGRLNEPVWQKATRPSPFVNSTGEGKPSQQTEVFLLRDAKTLYLGFRCHADEMSKLKSAVTRRDGDVWNDDCVEIFLDIRRTRAVYYHFIVNARGVQYDALTNDSPWNARWLSAAAREEKAWTCEVAIPFSELGVTNVTEGDSWFVNVCREEKPHDELSCWSATGSASFGSPGAFGELIFGTFAARCTREKGELLQQVKDLTQQIEKLKDAKLGEQVATLSREVGAFQSAATTPEQYLEDQKNLAKLRGRKEELAVAKFRADLGGEEYVMYERNPWLDFPAKTPIADIPGETRKVAVTMVGNATEPRALMLTNLTDQTLIGRVLLSGKAQPRVLVPTFVRTADGRVTADALPPADEIRKVELPPGETRQLFLNFSSGNLKPGEYPVKVTFSPLTVSKKEKSVEILWTVLSPKLPDVVPEVVFGWETLSDGGMDQEYLQALIEHKFNLFTVWGLRLRPHRPGNRDVIMVPGTDQNAPGLDFRELDRLLTLKKSAFVNRQVNHPKFYVILTCWENAGSNLDNYMNGWGTPEWISVFKKSILALRDRFFAQGLTYSDFALNPVDESIADPYVKMSTWIKEADPKLLVISDSLNGDSGDCSQVKKADAVTDLWCPNYGCFGPESTSKAIDYLRSTGKPIWMYYYSEGANEKVRPAYTDYLLRHWFAFQQGIVGTCYWTVSQHYGDPWNRHAIANAYDPCLLYPGTTTVVTGRRFEAWRQGAEDYALLARVREGAAKLTQKDAALAERAQALLKEATDTVVKKGGDPSVAGRYREKLAQALAEMEARLEQK